MPTPFPFAIYSGVYIVLLHYKAVSKRGIHYLVGATAVTRKAKATLDTLEQERRQGTLAGQI